MTTIASQVSPKLMSDTAAGWYGWFRPSSDRYGPNARFRARKFAIVYSPMTMASVRNAPDRSDVAQVREDHPPEDPRPARAEALGGLGQRPDVDRREAGVDRPVHVREGQHDVGADEQDVAAEVRLRSAGSAC